MFSLLCMYGADGSPYVDVLDGFMECSVSVPGSVLGQQDFCQRK